MDRRKTRDVLFAVFQWAKQDRRRLMAAYAHISGDPYYKEIQKDLRAVERMQKKIFGTTQSKLDRYVAEAERVPLHKMSEFLERNPHLLTQEEE